MSQKASLQYKTGGMNECEMPLAFRIRYLLTCARHFGQRNAAGAGWNFNHIRTSAVVRRRVAKRSRRCDVRGCRR